MIYCFDLDGTLCRTPGNSYKDSTPYKDAVAEVQRLYTEGCIIKIFTARGMSSKIDHTSLTKRQLKSWGVPYHELIMNSKPSFDILIDDRAINACEWRSAFGVRGIIAGCFDLIHPGYIKMIEDAKSVCSYLIIALHSDPTTERPHSHKLSPVHTSLEREIILKGLKGVDEVIHYETEEDLYKIIENSQVDIRILGSDCNNKPYTGDDLGIPVHFHERSHSWSYSKLRHKLNIL